MRILLPTGEATEALVRAAARGYDAEVVVTGAIASFLTPHQLRLLLQGDRYDIVIVSGMCTASFREVEDEFGIPIYRGPRHAADLSLVLPLVGTVELSRTLAADDFLTARRQQEADRTLRQKEEMAECEFYLRGIKVGGDSRMKVLAEIMDAPRQADLLGTVEDYFSRGADIVDLGFGFDATPEDVYHCFTLLEEIDRPVSIDTTDPALIEASLFRADLVLSLDETNLSLVGPLLAAEGVAAVVIPGRQGLEKNLETAQTLGISCLIADPILPPVGSGLADSLQRFSNPSVPLFFGAGNVTELIDADSIGVNALLAALAREVRAAVIFSSEHSDKTHGSIREMRKATEMAVLMEDRPYPKDLGIDLLILKEKRRRREPPLSYRRIQDADPMPAEITYDPCGNVRIGIEHDQILAVINGRAIRGKQWADVFYTLLSQGDVSLLDHAAYLGAELFKAELALRFRRSFEQDGPF